MKEDQVTSTTPGSVCYEIRLQGQLDQYQYDWLEEAELCLSGQETWIRIRLTDQPALFGLLKRIRDSGLSLLAINRLKDQGDTE